MTHGLHQIVMFGEPLTGETVQRLDRRLAAGRQTLGEKLAEQWVKAIPGRAVIGLDAMDQQILVLGTLNHVLGVGAARHELAQVGIEATQD
ncbi:hypothetical protein D3C73_1235470 [compost metagenome]